jgi:hypothetical protein
MVKSSLGPGESPSLHGRIGQAQRKLSPFNGDAGTRVGHGHFAERFAGRCRTRCVICGTVQDAFRNGYLPPPAATIHQLPPNLTRP